MNQKIVSFFLAASFLLLPFTYFVEGNEEEDDTGAPHPVVNGPRLLAWTQSPEVVDAKQDPAQKDRHAQHRREFEILTPAELAYQITEQDGEARDDEYPEMNVCRLV
mgnify:CR=1 FL=1